MPESKLLAQGAYGCVYYPGYSCDGLSQSKKYVSKLSIDNKDSKREYDIGKIIQTIPHYKKKFIVIERKCKITKMQKKQKECSLVKPNEKYILLYSEYLESITLAELLTNRTIDYFKLIQIVKTLTSRISDLIYAQVVHMDLHFGNILWSKEDKHLYVIDMGLALDMNKFFINHKINMDYLKAEWFHYNPNWGSWTIEYNLLAYMIHENTNINEELVLACINRYYEAHIANEFYTKDYVPETYAFFKPFLKNTKSKNMKLLLSYANTWDYYKIAFHFISYMNRKHIDFQELTMLCLLMMHPIPTFRPTPEEIKKIIQYFYKKEYSSYKIIQRQDAGLVEELTRSAKYELKK
jgi:serine/threonine protein kinase